MTPKDMKKRIINGCTKADDYFCNQPFFPQQNTTVFKNKRWKFRACFINKMNKINVVHNKSQVLISSIIFLL